MVCVSVHCHEKNKRVLSNDRKELRTIMKQRMKIFPKQRRRNVARTEWEWPVADKWPTTENKRSHSERAPLMRPVFYEMTPPVDVPSASTDSGKALSLNISSGGMLLMMEQLPDVDQVLKVNVPTPISVAEIATLAEVRWTRRLPFGKTNGGAYFVGLKFMF